LGGGGGIIHEEKQKENKKQNQNMAVNRGCRSVTIDIKALASSIECKMQDFFFMPSKGCIFKNPPVLSRHNEQAYILTFLQT
jgi:hypothetical protein